jgi:XTP/dITP diphosphohydrolase
MIIETKRELLLASHNAGKIRELTPLLEGVPVKLRSLSEFANVPEAEETGVTFEENAAIKASLYGRLTGLTTLADDSGLEVAALDGAPGVLSARYAGADATYEAKITRLFEEMKLSGVADRSARFVCVVALFELGAEGLRFFRGECVGRIAEEPRGLGGFGYDPVFIPNGYEKTFAELSPLIKQQISHRARAVLAARDYLIKSLPLNSRRPPKAR